MVPPRVGTRAQAQASLDIKYIDSTQLKSNLFDDLLQVIKLARLLNPAYLNIVPLMPQSL